MEKVIAVVTISIGLIILIAGVILNNITLIFAGPIISVLLFIFSYIKISKEKRDRMFIPRNEYETILSSRTKKDKKRIQKRFISLFMSITIVLIVFWIIWFFLSSYLYAPSPLATENIINDGCRELNPGTGKCEKDPSEIIVNFDVNEDGIVGGVNDTLSNLLKKDDCTGTCIRERCGCIS